MNKRRKTRASETTVFLVYVLLNADDTETNLNSYWSANQIVNRSPSNRINRQAHLPHETTMGGNDLEVNEILRRVVFSPMKGKLKGQWRARFLSGGAATTGKTKKDVAMNIIMNGKKINKRTGEIDVR